VSYWTRRLGRRGFIAASASAGASAAFIAACSGGNDSSDTKSQTSSGLVIKPVDNLKEAKSGGIYKSQVSQDVQTFEPSFRSAPTAFASAHAYQNLVSQKAGYMAPPGDEFLGDFVESWEFSPDKLTLTFKIRSQGKWDARAPTNGRNVDANDVVFSWKRFTAVGSLRADLSNKVNPEAPIVSMTASDSNTVVVKLLRPQASILAAVSSRAASGFWILPREAESGFDPKKDQRGSGAYVLSEYVPSSRFVFEKNPGYWDKHLMKIQRIEYPIITEYAQSLAQLKTGNVFTFQVRPEDILPTKNETPALNLYQTDITPDGFRWFFGFQDGAKSPFRDVRLRQAVAMTVDRDLFIDTFYNVASFEKAGLDMATGLSTAVRCDSPGWWLDPKGKSFGDNARFYKHDIAEAKKLIAAAGFANGVTADAHHIASGDYGPDFARRVLTILGMLPDSGIKLGSVPANFQTDWQQKYRDVKGNFDGMAFVLEVGSTDVGDTLYAMYNSLGSQFMGFDPDGRGTFKGDPMLDDLTNKMKTEFDSSKRQALGHELQRHEAKMQYYPRFPGGANGFSLVWPAVENWGVNRGGGSMAQGAGGFFAEHYLWVNDQKAPFKKA
jgi:peptide/nickel transport system substrate-binding protein